MLFRSGWQYWFAPKKPATDANSNANVAVNTAAPSPVPAAVPSPQAQSEAAAVTPDTTPARTITIKSPLYEVTLDSKGAVATSWIIKRNGSPKGDFEVFADGSGSGNEKPLQLIGQEALSRSPREVPFRLSTDDASVNSAVNDRNYQISVSEDSITLNPGEERSVDFTLTDASGVEVKKSFIFRADSFISDLGITIKKGGQPVPNAKLLIGASVGDHAIPHHNFYHIEPEAVALVGGDIKRHQGGYAFTFDANNQSTLTDQGTVDWAAVGDAYFAMAAIPAAPVQNIEYRASKYDVQVEPFYNSIFYWTLRSPKIGRAHV